MHNRHKGKFARENIVNWRENVVKSRKKQKITSVKDSHSGRRIIDIEKLGEDMWCTMCNLPLSFRFLVKEDLVGLASTFHIKCHQCTIIYQVHSSTYDKQNSSAKYHVNIKAALAILDGGIGETHLNTILSALNIPTINHNLLKRYERIAGPAIENVAKESCHEALKIEKEMTIVHDRSLNNMEVGLSDLPVTKNKDVLASNNNTTGLIISYDGAWLKKGSGQCYNSLEGHGTAFGHYSRKCIAYATRCKNCRYCSIQSKNKHDCRKNFDGSSKAMEADIAVQILTKNEDFVEENVHLKTLIGDEDSSTIANVRRASNETVAKWTDINHAMKKLTNHLYSLKKLSPIIIKYFRHCFRAALEAHKGDVALTKLAILNIVPHAFGEHDKCGIWCNYRKDPNQFKHKYLPGGKSLVGDELKISISAIFQQFANNAEKLAPCGSSQINENCNMVITSKAPKARHYSGSSSNDFRVAAAISQVNLGCTYIDEVKKKLGLSPLKRKSLYYRLERDKKRKMQNTKSKTLEYRRRRRTRVENRKKKDTTIENKEGITYAANSELDMITDFVDQPVTNSSCVSNVNTKIVFFDLETTGLRNTDEIVQIAAKIQEKTFNEYILPSCQFSRDASSITGLEVCDGELHKHSVPVKTIPPKYAASRFIDFLRSVSPSVILAAHNGHRFDAPRILQLMQKLNMIHEFLAVVVGFVDTLPLLKSKLIERKIEKKSFAQTALVSEYLGVNFIEGAHDAFTDVSLLEKLISNNNINISMVDLMNNAVTGQSILKTQNDNDKIKTAKISLNVLKATKENLSSGISASMINKIAKAGIRLIHIQDIFKNSGLKGLEILLSQNVGKGARVTTRKKIISALATKLTELNNNL